MAVGSVMLGYALRANPNLLCRFQQRRRGVAQLGEQRGLTAPGELVVALLDVTEAADLQRQRSESHGGVVIGGRKTRRDLVEQFLVVGDHLPLQTALARVAEQVPSGAAQPLALGEQAEDRQHPAPERHLARLARALVAAGQQRRSQVELELAPRLELLG